MFAFLRHFRQMRRALPPIKKSALCGACVGFFVSACAGGPLPRLNAGADPADAKVGIRPASYQSVTDGYVAARPASPILPGANAGAGAKAKP